MFKKLAEAFNSSFVSFVTNLYAGLMVILCIVDFNGFFTAEDYGFYAWLSTFIYTIIVICGVLFELFKSRKKQE